MYDIPFVILKVISIIKVCCKKKDQTNSVNISEYFKFKNVSLFYVVIYDGYGVKTYIIN